MKRVVLIVPNFRWVDTDKNALWHYLPYNLCLIAACVRDICDVSIIDAYKEDLSRLELYRRLSCLDPDIVGITVLMDKYGPAGHAVAKEAKLATDGRACVVMGGVYASMNAEHVIEDPNVDYVVKGEGEYAFRELVKWGVQNDSIIQAERITDLDALPLPAYDLIPYASYATTADRNSVDRPRALPYGRVLTSRGCPFGCCFCQVEQISGKNFRARSAEAVLYEIQWLKDTYGIKSLIFDDDNLLTDTTRARKIFRGIVEKNLIMPWVMIATAAFKLDRDLIALMRDSGCKYVNIAIESGNERVLRKIINKPINLAHAKEMVNVLKEYGIYVAANFIVGFPTETWDEIRKSLAFADELNANYTKIFAAMPLRNTRLWDMCEKEGAFKKGFTGTVQWSQGQIETEHFKADDLTVLRAYEWDRINFTDENKRRLTCKMMGISEQELLEIRRKTLSSSLLNLTTSGCSSPLHANLGARIVSTMKAIRRPATKL